MLIFRNFISENYRSIINYSSSLIEISPHGGIKEKKEKVSASFETHFATVNYAEHGPC